MNTTALHVPLRRVREYNHAHTVLRQVTEDVVQEWPSEVCRITCIYRTMKENIDAGAATTIHSVGPPYRAIDFGAAELGWDLVGKVADAINAKWVYDPHRLGLQVAVSKKHGTGPHLHIQVHPATLRRVIYENTNG